MCGISGIAGGNWTKAQLEKMVTSQNHRGPDINSIYINQDETVGLGHNRLSIIDLSAAGNQPMKSADERYVTVFNGEIYNYKELASQLKNYPFRSHSDTEVVLAAYQEWGVKCLDKFIGMFAFAIWDVQEKTLFCARDRFGVKPFYYHINNDTFFFVSEIKALHAAGVEMAMDEKVWSTYLCDGLYDHHENTFWKKIKSLPAGSYLFWKGNKISITKWYELQRHVGAGWDERSEGDLIEEYLSLLKDSIRLRFRSDVPVGINLSGGLDSSILLGLVDGFKGPDNDLLAFTFATGDQRYDELPWVQAMIKKTKHPLETCYLTSKEVPELAREIANAQDEPFGGIPTLAYSKIFKQARASGVIVLLDGQGFDEQWAGYDYYKNYLGSTLSADEVRGPVQASVKSVNSKDFLIEEFRGLSEKISPINYYNDSLQNALHQDAFVTKIPRALRFNDRISMKYSTELREPFLDHRLFEFSFRVPNELKIKNGVHKYLLRKLADQVLPSKVSQAPKRPIQTPQREWLKDDLQFWVNDCLKLVEEKFEGIWFKQGAIQQLWKQYRSGQFDNSFFIWQWISLALLLEKKN